EHTPPAVLSGGATDPAGFFRGSHSHQIVAELMSLQMDANSRARNAIDSTIKGGDVPTPSLARPKIVRVVARAFGVGVVLAAIAAHVRVSFPGDEYIGELAVLDRLFDLLLAGGLATAAFSVGSAIGRWLSIQYRGAAEELSFSVMLGTGVLGLATL